MHPALGRASATCVRLLPPELAHDIGIRALECLPRARTPPTLAPALAIRLFGLDFASPVGLAAGFDKDARVVHAFHRLGWGFVEIGAITPRPQSGNPKPRLFRLPGRTLVNRMGFNSEGLARIRPRLATRPANYPVFANLGTNRDTADPASDWEILIAGLAGRVDGFTLNVSSPNTPALQSLQDPDHLHLQLGRAVDARDRLAEDSPATKPPILVKLSPDSDAATLRRLASTCRESGVDGIIATNTSRRLRETLAGSALGEGGGVSGRPLREPACAALRILAAEVGESLPLIGVGGIETAEHAYGRLRAGANLVQLYTAMVWAGPSIGAEIARDLARLLERDGFSSVREAVGADL